MNASAFLDSPDEPTSAGSFLESGSRPSAAAFLDAPDEPQGTQAAPVTEQIKAAPAVAGAVLAESGLHTAAGFELQRASALTQQAQSGVGLEGRLLGQGGVPRTQAARVANAADKANVASAERATESGQYYNEEAAKQAEVAGVTPEVAAGNVSAVVRGLARGAGMAAEAHVPGIGLPLMAMQGATEAYGASKAAGASDKDAEEASIRSMIGLAIFGGANVATARGISRLLGPDKTALQTFLAQAVGQTAGNELTGRALAAWEAAETAPEGQKMEAVKKALSEMNLEATAQNVGFGLMGAAGAVKSSEMAKSIMDGTHPETARLALIATDNLTPENVRKQAIDALDNMQGEARNILGIKKVAPKARAAGLDRTADAIERSSEELLTDLSGEAAKVAVPEVKSPETAASSEKSAETNKTTPKEEEIEYSPFDTAGGFPLTHEIESGEIGATERPSQTTLAPDRFPVVEVPVKELVLSKEVPNFKSNADETTGVVEGQQLQGKYQRLGTGNIIVWERTDGTKEVVTGRHRFDLASRTNEPTIPSQIIREADGWTRQKVARLDAEANIRDGQGEIRDYANYFRGTEGTEADAAAGGLLSRAKGRAGWALGKYASEDLFGLYKAGKIREKHAVAIVQAAPGNPTMQREGVRFSQANPRESAESVRAHVEASEAAVSAGLAPAAEQGDLFGGNDSVMAAVDKAAAIAMELRQEAAGNVNILQTAKGKAGKLKLTKAEADRFGIKDRSSTAELEVALNKAKAEVLKWEQWHKEKATRDEVFAKAGVETPKAPVTVDVFHGSAEIARRGVFEGLRLDLSPAGAEREVGKTIDSMGTWWSSKREDAEVYGRYQDTSGAKQPGAVVLAKLTLKNPKIFESADAAMDYFRKFRKRDPEDRMGGTFAPRGDEIKASLQAEGFDGIVIKGGEPGLGAGKGDHYLSFDNSGVEVSGHEIGARKKAGDELFKGQADEPFNLVPETAADIAKRKALEEREALEKQEREAAEAKAIADKQQSQFFSYSDRAEKPEPLTDRGGRKYTPAVRMPDGKILTGETHPEIMMEIIKSGTDQSTRLRSERGYLTADGEFVSNLLEIARREGLRSSVSKSAVEAKSDAHHADIEAHVERIAKSFGRGVKVKVVRNESMLPDDVLRSLKARTHKGIVDVKTGDVWILSDHNPSRAIAERTVAHEVIGHYGVEKVLPAKEWAGLADSIFKNHPGIVEGLATRYFDKAAKDLTPAQRQTVAKEFVARLAEEPRINPTLWGRVVEAVRSALRAMGIRKEWSDGEIRDLIRRAGSEVEVGADMPNSPGRDLRASLMAEEIERRRSQVGGIEEIGHIYTVRNIAESTETVRRVQFNGEEPVSVDRSRQAWDLIETLQKPEGAELVARLNEQTGNDIGGALLQNELLRYAVKSAQEDGGKMIRHLLGGVNLFATGGGNVSAAGAILRARGEFSHPLWDAYTKIYHSADEVTAAILAGKGNELEGLRIVTAVKGALGDLKLSPDEFLTAIETARSEGGENLPQIIGRLLGVEVGKGTFNHDNPMLTAIVKLASHAYENGLNFKFQTFNTPIGENVKDLLKPSLMNMRAKLEKEGADRLESQWWQLLSDKARDREGPLSQADKALQAQLGAILKETMTRLGIVNINDIPKLTDPQKVAMVLGKGELRQGKVERVDEQVKSEIERRMNEELDKADGDPTKQAAIEAKYTMLRAAWEEANSSMLNVPVSSSMLNRLLHTELRANGGIKWNEVIEQNRVAALKKAAVEAAMKRVKDASAAHTEGLDYAPLEKALGSAFDAIAGVKINQHNMRTIERRALEAFRLTMKPEKTAEAIIDRLAKSQSDTQDFTKPKRAKINEIVRQEFQNDNPPAEGRKQAWSSQLVSKLMKEGVSESTAERLAAIVWREHQMRAAVREMRAQELATERGSLRPLVERILSTPLSEQSSPTWVKDIAIEYLKNAGLSTKQAETAATVFAHQMGKRLADAREAAARRVIERSEPWQRLMSRVSEGERKKIATDVDKIIEAVRAGATDPSRVFTEELARKNGWKGFTKEQHARLVELDNLINREGTGLHEVVRAQNEMLRMVENSKVPRGVMENLASSFHNNLLSGLPTLTINIFGPFGFMFRNMVQDLAHGIMVPSRIPATLRAFRESLKAYGPEFTWALKNDTYAHHFNETLHSLSTLDRWVTEGQEAFKAGRYHEALPKLIWGSTDWVRRMLSSLDQASKATRIAYAEQIYTADSMRRAGFTASDVRRLVEAVNVVKTRAQEDAIAAGMSKADARMHGVDAARDALMKGLGEKVGAKELSEVELTVRNEADLVVGHDSQHINEGLLSNMLPNQFLDAVARFRSDPHPGVRIMSTAVFGLVTIPYRMLRFGASFSPYGLVRYAVHKHRTGKGQRSLWEQSMGTKYQERQRLIEAVTGTALMGGLLAAFKPTVDDRDNDRDGFFMHITGAGPDGSDRLVQDAWRKKHKQHAIEFGINGKLVQIPYGRGVGEGFLFPLSFVGAYDDYRLKELHSKGKRQPNPIKLIPSLAAGYLATMAQRGAFIGLKNAGDLIARTTESRAPTVAGVVANNASNFIPFNRFIKTVSDFWMEQPDRSSVQAAIVANTPVVGPLFSKPALNALGDPISDDSLEGKAWFAGAPIILKIPKNDTNERVYGLIREKQQAPPTAIRTTVEKRYGVMDDDVWHRYVQTRGQFIKRQMLEEWAELRATPPQEFNARLNRFSMKAEEDTATLLRLEKLER